MKKFIVLYYSSPSAMEKMKESNPEDKKKEMEGWMQWAKNCGDGLVDMGAPLGNGQQVTADGSSASGSKVTGYSVLQADDMEKAVAMLQGHPHLGWSDGCEIEIHECMQMPEH
ncbi:MAG: hypothetical protein ABIC95_04270 [archaeon]